MSTLVKSFVYKYDIVVGSTVGRTMFTFVVAFGATIANNLSGSFGMATIDVATARESIE